MRLATVDSRASVGIEAPTVRVEVHISRGLPSLSIVGLPEAAVRESRDRVRAAIANAGFDFPRRRVIVNLAPADLPKEGARFDLAIALGILAAAGEIPEAAIEGRCFLGELSLSGALRPVQGMLPAACAAGKAGEQLIVPLENGPEAALASGTDTRVAESLLDVSNALVGDRELPGAQVDPVPAPVDVADLIDVRGQQQARRALEVAAAGGHSLLFVGPPGTGKSMLASRLPGILPPMSEEEALEAAAVASVSGEGLDPARWKRRSFRSPHHTCSGVALVGGGSQPRPGEISLAHHGVLFLDELPEYDRRVLEVLREPIETGEIHISRAARRATFPARFQLVAAMNPCPCGYLGDPKMDCRCTEEQISRYRNKISGPLLDRIDLQVSVPRPDRALLRPDAPAGESSASVRERVIQARERQQARQGKPNAALAGRQIEAYCLPDAGGSELLDRAMDRFGLSARAYHRILRLARTLADLEASENIRASHIGEAIQYRSLERGDGEGPISAIA
jgi:magnesium chelatase family protein